MKIIDKRGAGTPGQSFGDLEKGDWFEWTGLGTSDYPCVKLKEDQYGYYKGERFHSSGGARSDSGPVRKLNVSLVIEDEVAR